jgi:hypothetical protein
LPNHSGRFCGLGWSPERLDITENIVFNAFCGITPWRIFQFIASGLIDGRSFQFGWASVGLGFLISLCDRAHLDRDLLHRRDSVQRAVTTADALRVDLRHHCLRRHEFHRAAAFGSSTSTGRGHTYLTGQRGPGVDVLYRIAGRAPGRKGAES